MKSRIKKNKYQIYMGYKIWKGLTCNKKSIWKYSKWKIKKMKSKEFDFNDSKNDSKGSIK